MRPNAILAALLVCLAWAIWAVRTDAAPRVEMTIGAEQGLPAGVTQSWYRLLTELGIERLQIRSRRTGEQPGIEESRVEQPGGRPATPVYEVTGVLDSRNRLSLPGGRFTTRDAAQIKAWLAKLREEGAEGVTDGSPRPFGLTADQLQQLTSELAVPLGFSTVKLSPGAVLQQARVQLTTPVVVEPAAAALLSNTATLQDELRSVATGTAIACLLREAGLALVPARGRDQSVSLHIRAANPRLAAWPVGVEPERRPTELAAGLYEILTVELDDVPVSQVVQAIGQRVGLPILYDRYALAKHGIDPTAARVNVPERRTSYSVALRLALGQARLKSQLRVDDAGQPFLWVTTFKPAD